ncbi:hypothetical protein TcWFU_006976 [Taenia crassiceps]|uniref:Uncharacterized protein n=1 Tax=Taenia crassiceps TaxID=6207 RepID=A0ABR4QI61_9CEST
MCPRSAALVCATEEGKRLSHHFWSVECSKAPDMQPYLPTNPPVSCGKKVALTSERIRASGGALPSAFVKPSCKVKVANRTRQRRSDILKAGVGEMPCSLTVHAYIYTRQGSVLDPHSATSRTVETHERA